MPNLYIGNAAMKENLLPTNREWDFLKECSTYTLLSPPDTNLLSVRCSSYEQAKEIYEECSDACENAWTSIFYDYEWGRHILRFSSEKDLLWFKLRFSDSFYPDIKTRKWQMEFLIDSYMFPKINEFVQYISENYCFQPIFKILDPVSMNYVYKTQNIYDTQVLMTAFRLNKTDYSSYLS